MARVSDSPVLLRRRNLAPLLLVNLGVGMHAMIWYMASTVIPSTVAELQAAAYIGWATSVYLVTMILGAVLMAPAKARLGARAAMLLAGVIVMLGGMVAALAPSIAAVLLGRALQGLGEGMLVALSYALVRELFETALVPKVFGIQAATWGIAIFLGPMVGGWLTEVWSWRAAFWGTAALPLPLLALAWRILQQPAQSSPTLPPVPLWRLALLATGVMAITVADRLTPWTTGFASVTGGVLLIAAVVVLDRRAAPHLFPTVFAGLHHPVSLGLWVILLMPLAQAPVYVYGPYLLQMHRGLSPTMAGIMGATHAIAWSITAMLAPLLPTRWHSRTIVAGPALLSFGLAGLAFSIAARPLEMVVASLVLVGMGFGICNMFINQRILAAAQSGQEDATAGAIPTLQGLGGAVSAALAGLAANALGLDRALTPGAVADSALAMFGVGAVLALAAVAVAILFLRALAQHHFRTAKPPSGDVPT